MYNRSSSVQYDDIVLPGSIQFTGEADPIVEPVLIDDVKNFLHISGTSEDLIIASLVKSAREWVERMTGLSLIERTVTCTVQVRDFVELPYGPVTSAVTNKADNTITYIAFDFPFPLFSTPGQYAVSYAAGYTILTIPESLKMAIMCRVGATYENRGDKDEQNYSQMAKSYYRSYRRLMSWL